MKNKARFELIDGVRGAAILWIVVYHLLNEHTKAYPAFFSNIIKSGHLGVPIFFIVSGFAVSTAASKVLEGKDTALQFLLRRLSRIYQPLVYSLITAGIVIPVLCWAVCQPFGIDASEYFFHYSSWEWVGLFTLTKIFVPAAGDLNRSFVPINGALWFVAVLVQMYLVIFIALLNRRFYYPVLFAVTALWVTTLFPHGTAWIPRGLFITAWAPFAAGIALYHGLSQGHWKLRVVLCAGAAGLAWASFSDLTFTLFFALLLWALYPVDETISHGRWFKPFVFLGSFSYSLYLLHIPLDQLVTLLAGGVNPFHFPDPVLDPLLIIPGIVLLSWLWSLVFEKHSFFNRGAAARLH